MNEGMRISWIGTNRFSGRVATRRKPLVPRSFGGKAELLAFPTSAVPPARLPACLPPHEDKEVDKSPQGLS